MVYRVPFDKKTKIMAETVNEAFSIFLKDCVNLDSEETKTARKSRDWLFGQISSFQSDETFPKSNPDFDISFGSFARRTKKRRLDDIDIMICLWAFSGVYSGDLNDITIAVHQDSPLITFCNDYSNTLNSTKIINKIIKKCATVSQYRKAELKRNGAAAVLSLQSYDWCFDIVPCFMTATEYDGRDYYLIPNGYGNWKKTDPRIDRNRVKQINQFHAGNVLNVIRIIKYWNKRATMPSIGSYLLETIILDYYAMRPESDKASDYVNLEIPRVLQYIADHIRSIIYDPKKIQGDINNLSWDDRSKISTRASLDKQKAEEARTFEINGNHKCSIQKWREIFGNDFPMYE